MTPFSWGNRAVRVLGWILIGVFGLIVVAIIASYAANDKLREYSQNKINSHLKAYEMRIGKLRLHPIGLYAEIYDFDIIQKAAPDPPIVSIPRLKSGIHWSQIVRGRVVGDVEVFQPKLHVDLNNIEQEKKENYPIMRESWQEAVESVYPLKMDYILVHDARMSYAPKGDFKPLEMSHINLVARNIQNISSPEDVYPSSVHIEGVVFENGSLTVDGNANFLAQPHVTVKGSFDLEKMVLDYFEPIAQRYDVSLTTGVLSTRGKVEYGAKEQTYEITELTLDGVKLNYTHKAQNAGKEKKGSNEKSVTKKAAQSAKELSNNPTVTTEIERLKITNGVFGFINETTDPNYRVFISDTNAELANFSNQFEKGPATFHLTGNFMDSGPTKITATFRPEKNGPDFDLDMAIENAKLKSMSDIFRAYGDFDIESGLFSFYSQMDVGNQRVNGYVKPMFKDMEVTDKRSEDQKNAFHDLYVGVVGAISKLLENPQDRVATKADISGPLEDPNADPLQIIVNLIQNAFFKSILPGFSENIPAARK